MTVATTRKRKSPGGHQGKNRGGNEKLLSSSYPALPDHVKENQCRTCQYFRLMERAGRRRIFCAFTGENIDWSFCEFWSVAEVSHA